MQTNVIDLIIQMVRGLRLGKQLKDLKPDLLKNYDRSEVSAAYSWVLHKMESGELQGGKAVDNKDFRILHSAERMVISTEAYGYMIELYNIGILDHRDIEFIIEQSMMNNFEKVELTKMKELVKRQVFGSELKSRSSRIYLSGNEHIN